MTARKLFLSVALLALAELPALGGKPERVVLLPFENLSGVQEGPGELADGIEKGLARRGYAVVRGEEVERFLEENRVRHLDSLAAPLRSALLARFDAGGVLTGSVYTYLEGETPIVAVSARLVREDGRAVWAELVGLTPEDTEGLLALGRAGTRAELAAKAAARLTGGLPAPGSSLKGGFSGGKPFRLSPPRTFVSAEFPRAGSRRVCLLPFENFTDVREAPRVVLGLLARRLAQTGSFEIVEPAEFRTAMAEEKIRSFRDMDPSVLLRLGKRVGTNLFLRGTIYSYREASPKTGARTPQVEFQLSLVDVLSGRILWASSHARKGDDYRALFQLGAIGEVVSLSDQVLAEMVQAEEKAVSQKGQVKP